MGDDLTVEWEHLVLPYLRSLTQDELPGNLKNFFKIQIFSRCLRFVEEVPQI